MTPTGGANNEAALPVPLDEPAAGASSTSRVEYRATDAHPTDPQTSAVQHLDVTVTMPATTNTDDPLIEATWPGTVNTATPVLYVKVTDANGVSGVVWRENGGALQAASLVAGTTDTYQITPTLPPGSSEIEIRAFDAF